MAEFVPQPFGSLVSRMFRELELHDEVFDLPRRAFFTGDPTKDFSVRFHGMTASSPLGPAAGPHTQLAQNIVLAWLGGARIFELKTVQVLDRLKIPRPCIDLRNVGYNVEWSQELRTEESLEEYVKASMLIDLLRASGKVPLAPGFDRSIFDLSVGYDLKGVKSEKVRAFIGGMKDAREVVARLRAQIAQRHSALRGTAFRADVSRSVTLSTFHGCPPDEIEAIASFMLEEMGLDCIVKLNPTLLGPKDLRALLNDQLGYADVRVPEEAFAKDATWEQACGIVSRLAAKAERLGRGFGVKFSNTLVVENREGFLPASENTMYLSGAPLHVLAMTLVARFRAQFGASVPVSFSAGIDRKNFPDAVCLGLVPVTTCSDLLAPGGYGRLRGYGEELARRMAAAGAATIPEFIAKSRGGSIEANTKAYAAQIVQDARYHKDRNSALPKKLGTRLDLFDCVTCDKCVPVCPNDANFTYDLPVGEVPIVKLRHEGAVWTSRTEGRLRFDKKHQLANFADFCNECGNCDVFCPEDGGPYVVKPRFFGTRDLWMRTKDRDGFALERGGGVDSVCGRFSGREYFLTLRGGEADYAGPGFHVEYRLADPAGTVRGEADVEVDLTYALIMDLLLKALFAPDAVNYVNAGQ
ncbi:MAG: glutamate synthase [Elusimicrobia bacterium]|nr:glutamate synthase [Elusimicrobiota bacterium]